MTKSVAVGSLRSRHCVNPFESLERRVMLTAATSAVARPVIQELVDLTTVPRTREVLKLERAGANLFDGIARTGAARNGTTTLTDIVSRASAFTLNLSGIRQTLKTAPLEFTPGASSPLTLALPTPGGTYSRFAIVEAPIMEAGLARQFPDIKTYRGQGIDDPTATVRLDFTQLGFHAQVLSPNGAYYINPQYHLDANGTYLSYYKRDAVRPTALANYDLHMGDQHDDMGQNIHVGLEDGETTVNGGTLNAAPFGSQLRTFRLAVAANNQYSAVFGSNVANVQAAIVQAVNRVVGVYETELAVRMTLIANNSALTWTSSAGDPFASNNGNWLDTCTTTFNNIIGSSSYDIGHQFTTGSGGVAYLGVVGSGSKAAGTTGLPSPTGDVFYIDYVAHEMGHQFGANHTFNVSHSQRSFSHAYEPGSGSTIMGYAGLFGANDVQPNSDPYMHSDSIDAIRTLVGNISGVGTTTNTGNNPPTVAALTNYTIPTSTPFALTSSATDPDGDALTYEWQERELGAALALNGADNGASPLNRAIVPTVSPTRMLPRLSAVLNGTHVVNNSSGRPVERLYTVARNPASWRVIVRDNKSGGGGVASQDLNITVVNIGAAFLITNNNSAATLPGGSTLGVAWNVAGTTGNGIDVANVKISLSTNAGQSFNTVLAASTANDGSEDVVIPNINASNVRIKVEAVGNIFFDINNGSLTIQQQTVANGTWTGLGDGTSWNQASNWSNNTIPGVNDDVIINVAANPTINIAGAQSVRSVTSAEALNLTGTLAIAQASTFNGAFTSSAGTINTTAAMTFNGGLALDGGVIEGIVNIPVGAALNVTGSGLSTIFGDLNVNGTASLLPGGDKTLHVGSDLNITGLFDLNDNDLVIGSGEFGTGNLFKYATYINSGRNGGDWLGTTGLTSTSARNAKPRNTMLGVMTAPEYWAANGAITFNGVHVEQSMILVKYTYYGDADFNGVVNFDDYARTDAGFNSGTGFWSNGNFDLTGVVNFDDYGLIDLAFNTQGGTL